MAKILIRRWVCDYWTSIDLWTLQQSWRSLAVQQCSHEENHSSFWHHFHSASSFGTSEQNPKACQNFGSYFPLFYITAANKTNLCRPEELSYLQDATSVIAAEQNWGYGFIPMEDDFFGTETVEPIMEVTWPNCFFFPPSNWRLCIYLFQSSPRPMHSRPPRVRWALCKRNAKRHQQILDF